MDDNELRAKVIESDNARQTDRNIGIVIALCFVTLLSSLTVGCVVTRETPQITAARMQQEHEFDMQKQRDTQARKMKCIEMKGSWDERAETCSF